MLHKSMFTVFSIILSGLFISSCNVKTDNSGKARSIGNTSEILVVVQSEEQWDGQVGKAIKNYFGQQQYGLPQNEPIYKLSHVKVSSFNDLFKKHRNLLIININKNVKKSKVELIKNLWAKPQRVIKISSPSVKEFIKTFKLNKSTMMKEYNQDERARIMSVFRPNNDIEVVKKVMKKFDLQMTIPQGFYVAKTKPGFMWIRKEANAYSQGIVILSFPYSDTTQFSKSSIVSLTADYLKRYIPGPTENSFMTIDTINMPPKDRVITDFFTDYAVEIRGLWRVEHDFMGGPFVSYTFVDWRKNQIITMFGYVYQPNKPKRNLLLQVESIIYSTRFYNKEK